MLAAHECIWTAEEDFTRAVLPVFATEGTLNGNRLKRELPQAGGHIAAAGLKMLMPSNTAVLKTVPRKYEAGETGEICEIFRRVFSISYVFSIC